MRYTQWSESPKYTVEIRLEGFQSNSFGAAFLQGIYRLTESLYYGYLSCRLLWSSVLYPGPALGRLKFES